MTAPVIDPGLFPLKPLKASINCQKFLIGLMHVYTREISEVADTCWWTSLDSSVPLCFHQKNKKQKCQQRNFDYKNLQILKFLDKIVQESINQTKITSVLCVLFYTRYQKMVHLSRGGSTTRFWALESPGPPEDLLNICLLHVHLRRYSR